MEPAGNRWYCEVYGPDIAQVGVLCFLAELGERACESALACHQIMEGERQRLFRRISDRAASGDLAAASLAECFLPGQELRPADQRTDRHGTGQR